MRNLLGGASRRGGIKMSKLASMLFSLILYIQNVLNSFEISSRTRETIDAIHTRLNSCANFIQKGNRLIEITNEVLDNSDEVIENPFPILSQSTFREEPSLFSNKGSILVSYKIIEENVERFHQLLTRVGELDYLVNVVELLNSSVLEGGNYVFSEYLVNDKPQIDAKDMASMFGKRKSGFKSIS